MQPSTAHRRRARRAAATRGLGRLRVLFVGVLFLTLTSVSAPAMAFWTQAGAATASGTGSASTGTLAAPTGAGASVPNGGTNVTVTWTAPATGVAPTGYQVVRTSTATSSTAAACGSSATSPVTTTSCVDASVPDGTYRYTVVALRPGWTATSADSSPVTVLQSIATTTTLTTSGSPSLVGQTVTFTATVGAASGTPTGTVVFRSGGTALTCSGGSQTLSSGVATCSVAFASSGTRSITAAYAGSAPFTASTSSALAQVVDQQTQSVTFTSTAPSGATVGAATYSVTATASSGLAVTYSTSTPAVCTSSGPTITFVGGGTCTVLADQAGNAAWAAAPQRSQTFSVAKASQTITVSSTAPTGAATGGTYTVNATASSGLAVSYSTSTPAVCTVSGPTVTFVGAGTCTVLADQAGNAAWSTAPQRSQSFTVAKAAQTVSFTSAAPTSATMGDTAYAVTATASSGLPVTFSSATPTVCAVNGSTVSYLSAGTCTVDADQNGNAGYAAAPRVTQSFLVAAAPSAPGNLQVTGTSSSATATWTGVTGYTYECQNTNGSSTPVPGAWFGCAPGVTFTPKNGQQLFWVRGLRGPIVTDAASVSFKP